MTFDCLGIKVDILPAQSQSGPVQHCQNVLQNQSVIVNFYIPKMDNLQL